MKILYTALILLGLLTGCNSNATQPVPPVPPEPDPTLKLAANPTILKVAGEVTLTATPSSTKNLIKMEFYRNGSLFFTDSEAPYSARQGFTEGQNGTYTYTAKSFYSKDITAQSAAVSVSVNIAGSLARPLVTFVSDDGSKQDILKLLPIFKEKNAVAVAGIVTAYIGKDDWHMNQTDLLDLQAAGWELASHTRTHVGLNALSSTDLAKELHDSKLDLEALGVKVTTLVYPYGGPSDAVLQAAAQEYQVGLNAWGGLNLQPLKLLNLNRVPFGAFTSGNNSLASYIGQVDAAIQQKGWLIFMLHPFADEFDSVQLQHLKDTLDDINSKKIPVVTIQQGLKLLGL
ncbi:polysaccharide deacetylase family protein [Deinococcus roseus]|uniref:NodB homology domain-containing protein n=1 Tax=Deinococcus roseus TaxID=392414 RepID=A0ABQ2D245_9DEIO|nr:polysaccharide deacetylase family protein [Deinococcus roseus]GGJ42683.1 hypothetical protein GCM10008938_31020 [Deinococcus roseus]